MPQRARDATAAGCTHRKIVIWSYNITFNPITAGHAYSRLNLFY